MFAFEDPKNPFVATHDKSSMTPKLAGLLAPHGSYIMTVALNSVSVSKVSIHKVLALGQSSEKWSISQYEWSDLQQVYEPMNTNHDCFLPLFHRSNSSWFVKKKKNPPDSALHCRFHVCTFFRGLCFHSCPAFLLNCFAPIFSSYLI